MQWGKEVGPYARLRALGAGEGDSRFGAAIRENNSRGSEKRVDSRGSGELHRDHKETAPIIIITQREDAVSTVPTTPSVLSAHLERRGVYQRVSAPPRSEASAAA